MRLLFQSTRPRGARREVRRTEDLKTPFQSTRPRGARPGKSPPVCGWPRFNPRAHAGRDIQLPVDSRFIGSFQSTRPRGARRGRRPHPRSRARVSIHAPTRGATRAHCETRPLSGRFNPRAHAGRDASTMTVRFIKPWFQSTRPRGARRCSKGAVALRVRVSIHAPTRGATRGACSTRGRGTAFQSTRPRGARHQGVILTMPAPMFQSTRPRGARPAPVLPATLVTGFQSTRPRGARRSGRARSCITSVVSIHAPTRGATVRPRHGQQAAAPVSIHAPTRGATPRRAGSRLYRARFNPRAHAGRDVTPSDSKLSFQMMFQSTRPRGARRVPRPVPSSLALFQSTRPRGARRL